MDTFEEIQSHTTEKGKAQEGGGNVDLEDALEGAFEWNAEIQRVCRGEDPHFQTPTPITLRATQTLHHRPPSFLNR
jgi:hypothetical protein